MALAFIGLISPNILVFAGAVETGNILLYVHPLATIEGMFANGISAIFMIDLLFTVLVFFIRSNAERNKYGRRIGIVWLLTLLRGLAGGLPFFLYLKEKAMAS